MYTRVLIWCLLTLHKCIWTINKPHLSNKNKSRCYAKSPTVQGVHFKQYQASPTVLGWPGTGISYTEYSQMALPKRSEAAPQKLLKSTVSLYSCLSCEDHSNRIHASCKCKFMIRILHCCGGEPEWVCYLWRELWTVSSGTLTRRRPVTPCMYLSDYIAIVIMQIMQSPYTLVEAYICRETGDESPSMHP